MPDEAEKSSNVRGTVHTVVQFVPSLEPWIMKEVLAVTVLVKLSWNMNFIDLIVRAVPMSRVTLFALSVLLPRVQYQLFSL